MTKQLLSEKFRRFYLPVFFVFFAVITAIATIHWRMAVDTPLFLYFGFLISDCNMLPYKDFLEVNPPFILFLYALLYKLIGSSDIGVRFVDLFITALISFSTFGFMRRIDKSVAVVSAALWPIIYFSLGPFATLQRDVFLLLTITLTIAILANMGNGRNGVFFVLAGFIGGIGIAIRPMAIVYLPAYILLCAFIGKQRHNITKYSVLFIAGTAVPIVLTLFYLLMSQSLGDFVNTAVYIWPEMRGQMYTGLTRLMVDLRTLTEFRGFYAWIALAILGTYIALFNSAFDNDKKALIYIMLLIFVSSLLYMELYAKYLLPHWIVSFYTVILLSSLCFVKPLAEYGSIQKWFPLLFVLVFFLASAFDGLYPNISSPIVGALKKEYSPNNSMYYGYHDRVNAISDYLTWHAEQGDNVQPVGTGDGLGHALLKARMPIASYMTYEWKLSNEMNPFVREIRERVIVELNERKPKYIIGMPIKESVGFDEFNAILQNNYTMVDSVDALGRIYRLRNDVE